jgi:hypothetical protein
VGPHNRAVRSKVTFLDIAGLTSLVERSPALGILTPVVRMGQSRRRNPSQQLRFGPTNAGRLRGDGNDEKGAGSERQRQGQQGPGNVHRRTISSRRLRGEPDPLADEPRPKGKRCNRTRFVRLTGSTCPAAGESRQPGWKRRRFCCVRGSRRSGPTRRCRQTGSGNRARTFGSSLTRVSPS